jgi:hypothetical protein
MSSSARTLQRHPSLRSSLAKYAAAFFNKSRSSLTSASSRLTRASSCSSSPSTGRSGPTSVNVDGYCSGVGALERRVLIRLSTKILIKPVLVSVR